MKIIRKTRGCNLAHPRVIANCNEFVLKCAPCKLPDEGREIGAGAFKENPKIFIARTVCFFRHAICRSRLKREQSRETEKDVMNALLVKGGWNIAKGRVKQKLARWMKDELQFSEGKEDELLGRIQKRKGRGLGGNVPAMGSCCRCNRPSK
jgi:uncharacterized protein YjbJ (UPF0337 family)